MGLIAKTSLATCCAVILGLGLVSWFGDPMGGQPRANLAFKTTKPIADAPSKTPTRPTPQALSNTQPANKALITLKTPPQVQASNFNGKTPIALIVTGLGLDERKTEKALFQLPPAATLGFSPYGENLSYWSNRLNAIGRGFWLELPLESHDPERFDNGPHSLSIKLPDDENLSRLNWVLKRMEGEQGLIAPSGESFLNNRQSCLPIAGKLNNEGIRLAYVPKQQCQLMQDRSAKLTQFHQSIDTIVDIMKTSNQIERKLRELEQKAKTQGFAIGLADPNSLSLRLIAKWSESLSSRGFVLVPLSQTIKGRPRS